MQFEAVIGLEVHAQMLTESKIFCGCSNKFGSEPNTQTCPVCIGMPGVLPVLNKKALQLAIKTGLALNCTIAQYSRFARKNYFYPDLPKAYQISQYEQPICEHGFLEITVNGQSKRIGITRIHMEEDAGKTIHEAQHSLVDLNRTGTPLLEIVSEPDIRTPAEAVAYMKKLHNILRWIDVCDGNMQEGSLRCDANVSVRPVGQKDLGTRTEIKNLNSFRFLEKAIEYEIKRQISLLKQGQKITQETRLFDSTTGTTHSMRSKEEAHDYRYFPDPDLVAIVLTNQEIEQVRQSLPELPTERCLRYKDQYGLSEADAEFLTSQKALSDWFEQALQAGAKPKPTANWIMVELMARLNATAKDITDCPIKPEQLAELLRLIDSGVISGKIAKTVFDEMFQTGMSPEAIVKQKGLSQITDTEAITQVVKDVLANYPKEVERYKQGDEKLLGFFVGQIMKQTKGKSNPKAVNDILLSMLKSQ